MADGNDRVRLEPGWKQALASEFSSDYMTQLRAFLLAEKQQGKVVYPPGAQIFNAFEHTPFDQVKVVILGQDPYHGPGQAHGLCFSVPEGVPPPPSLINIFKEISRDFGTPMSRNGNLEHWADQDVLLLNATLTVVQGQAGAHQGKGWSKPLLQIILQRADTEQMPVYLETAEESNLSLYRRYGFEVTTILTGLPGDAPPLWCMWREPGRSD